MSFSKISAISGALALASTVAAHGTVSGIVADGVYYEGYSANFQYMSTQPVVVGWSTPQDQSNGFIAPDAYTTSDIICHLGATNAQTSATVKAGGSVELQWTPWPSSHHGPVIDYLASCNGDCTTVDKTALEFFKIDGVGLLDDTTIPGNWATDTLIANNNSWTVTIPTDIAPGNYVLRHEIIALHSAGTTDGAQNYPQCFNLEVTGSGTAVPTGTLGEALYTPSDAGILINIYAAISSYVVPGPTLYSGAISASQTLDAAATSIAAVGTAASSAAAVVTSSAASVVASSSAASPATLVAASPSSGVTAAPINASGAPFSNGTASASKKSKSACKVKTSKSAPALSSITQVAQVSSSASLSTMSFADSVTIPTTSIAIPTTTSTSISSVATPVSGSTDTTASTASVTTSSDATVPSGTTLGNLLSWISSFYAKNSGTDYNENTVARRSFLARREHSRQLVARQEMEKFDGVKAAATGTHPGFPQGTGHAHHGHGHAHGTGVQGGAKPTGAFASGKAFPTGSGKFRIGA